MRMRFTSLIIGALGFLMLLVCSAPARAVNDEAAIIQGDPLVIHFEKGKSALSDADKARIKALMEASGFGPDDKMLLVGHSDSAGDEEKNLKLSYKRAQAVRREIISSLGINGKNVLAMGRGEENPVGDNKSQSGRASNRRVEVYLAQVVRGQLKDKDKRIDVDKVAVAALVKDAGMKLRSRHVQEALQLLQMARAKGGDQVSDWHGMYGIAGFYAGIASEKVRSHLTIALNLDPYNQDARSFLGRLDAREKVRSGKVNQYMGRSPDDALFVTTDSQIYEYLELFGMQPLSYRDSAIDDMQIWSCRGGDDRPVEYYFDRSQRFAWAFAGNNTVVPEMQQETKRKADLSGKVRAQEENIGESKLFR